MKYKPMLDGFELKLLSPTDTVIEKAIVEYEIPFADGAILDDMGVKARRFQVRTIWRGQNYEHAEYFIEHTKLNQINTFVHPELGTINGRIKSLKALHDRRRQCAEISFEFIEDSNRDIMPAFNPPLEANLEEGFEKTAKAMMDAAAAEYGAAGLDTSTEVNPNQPLGGQVPARTVSARAFLARLDQSITGLRGMLADITNPAESVVGMFNYGLSLPGVVIGAVAAAVERAAMAANNAGTAPIMFVSSLRSNIGRLAASVPLLRDNIMVAAASIGALITGRIFAADEREKAVLRRIENAQVWRPDGTMLRTPAAPQVLAANELDESLARIREVIQDGMTAARAMGCTPAVFVLAGQADELTRYINAVKVLRDRIINVEVEDDMPLHLLCLKYGLPYAYADRIVTINNFRNPNFVSGQARLYERHG
ncbi:MAG: DNA circularization N-terminal domain-containing protein [Chitinispirillia bacterium]|nr:DNA circularization N-terminal domain-containing protein [Chitinispirillia bacterium]MCL2268605.1 DNA circularization N-terminal domain-containing protein [Chitinispirillia bacterium]